MRGLSETASGALWIAIVALLSVCAADATRADDGSLSAAEAAYARGSLREAQRLFQASLRQPGHEREALVRIHLHLGILAGAQNADRTARAHFAIALALDPTLAAPSELAGRDRSRFEQERPEHALSAVIEPEEASFVVRVSHAPPRLVRRIVVRCGEEAIETLPVGRGADVAAVRAVRVCDRAIAVHLEDEHGGVLLRHTHAAATTDGTAP